MDLSTDRPSHVHPHTFAVGPKDRAELLRQTSGIVWFPGLPAAGKSTLAGALEVALHNDGKHSFLLDGDAVRTGLSTGCGFLKIGLTFNKYTVLYFCIRRYGSARRGDARTWLAGLAMPQTSGITARCVGLETRASLRDRPWQ
jgi:hypothetical protein